MGMMTLLQCAVCRDAGRMMMMMMTIMDGPRQNRSCPPRLHQGCRPTTGSWAGHPLCAWQQFLLAEAKA
eukprot:1148458-Pelagomonas_calceolata.AAC.2